MLPPHPCSEESLGSSPIFPSLTSCWLHASLPPSEEPTARWLAGCRKHPLISSGSCRAYQGVFWPSACTHLPLTCAQAMKELFEARSSGPQVVGLSSWAKAQATTTVGYVTFTPAPIRSSVASKIRAFNNM